MCLILATTNVKLHLLFFVMTIIGVMCRYVTTLNNKGKNETYKKFRDTHGHEHQQLRASS